MQMLEQARPVCTHALTSSTYFTDGFKDGKDGLPPSPPQHADIGVFTHEYLDGYLQGKTEQGNKAHDWLGCRLALANARIKLAIENGVYVAHITMGSPSSFLNHALERLKACEREVTDCEDALFQSIVLREQGIEPFCAEKWAKSCMVAMAELSSPEKALSSQKLQLWSSESLGLIHAANKSEAGRIYLAVKDEALGIAPFNAERFDKACAEASSEAANGCGLSDVLWSRRATAAIHDLLFRVDNECIATAKEIAGRNGWMTDDELNEMDEMIEDDGLCSHGLDPHCCPCGCGDL